MNEAATIPVKPPVVELKAVSKWFPGLNKSEKIQAVGPIDLQIPDDEAGEFVALLGPSGCGKSTLLNMISGIASPSDGEILVFGESVETENNRTVTVPQAYTCFPWLTALQNVAFGLSLQSKSLKEQKSVAREYLEKVGLGDRATAYPRELSGGMQQRVAIARTLAMRPRLMLMDEPFGALDAQTRSEMQGMLTGLWEKEKNSILFITHDVSEALLLADRILVLSPRPARIIYDMKVPFPRPRSGELIFEQNFVEVMKSLLEFLKHPPSEE